jgi:cold shock CspA family protein
MAREPAGCGEESTMAWDTIKDLTTYRGFGFILPEGQAIAGKDLYFNRMDVPGTAAFEQLRAGQRVEYDLGRDKSRGTPKAANVRSIPQP